MNHKERFVIKLALAILLLLKPVSGNGSIVVSPQSQNGSRIRVVLTGINTNSDPLEASSLFGGILNVTGGSSSGAIAVEDLSITKAIDKTTPQLSLRVANGAPITTVTLKVYSVDANNVETLFLTITLTDVHIVAVNPMTDTTKALSSPIETVKLHYCGITYSYFVPGLPPPGHLDFTYDSCP
jgi:hypothetical protein